MPKIRNFVAKYAIMKTQIINGTVVTPDGLIEGGSVVVDGTKIKSVLHTGEIQPGVDNIVDAEGGYIMPGGIDMHVHGGGGRDFMETTPEAFMVAVETHRRHGTTAILPTLAASSDEMMAAAAETCAELMKDQANGILGLHFEGPYFNPKKAGGQIPEYIRNPDPEQYRPLIEGYSCIRRWDASPELPGACEFAEYATGKGVMVALGHTNARYPEVERGHKAGFSHATHFYNAMPCYHKEGIYSADGTVEAVYLMDDMTVEVICDGIHVPPVVIRLIHKFKGRDRVALITDAVACTDAPAGAKAFDPRVIVEDGVCKLADRSALAGSVATMDRLIRTCVVDAGLPIEDVAIMASLTPARILGVDKTKGSIEAGKDADIIIMTPEMQLTRVMQMGRLVD